MKKQTKDKDLEKWFSEFRRRSAKIMFQKTKIK